MKVSELISPVSPLNEGTWSLPDTVDKVREVLALLKEPIKWSNNKALKNVYDLLGDDDLFDDLDATKRDRALDIRPVLVKHIERLTDTRTWASQPDEETKFALGMLRRKAAALKAGWSAHPPSAGSPHTP